MISQKTWAGVAAHRLLLVLVVTMVGDSIALKAPVVKALFEMSEKSLTNVETIVELRLHPISEPTGGSPSPDGVHGASAILNADSSLLKGGPS